jgi:diguanylate cyclase (GGDEF)-like protein
VVRGLSAGADGFLKKPVDRDELLTRLYSGGRVLDLEQRLRNLARIEPLTGLFTRNTFLDLLEKEWSRSSRHHLPMSCAILEVDHGQRISERYGRQTAEEVVRQVAQTLGGCSRKSDVIAHDGADAFMVLLPETNEPQAAPWSERVARSLRQLEISVDGAAPLRITASAGIAERLHDTSSATQLLRMAEEALLVAKRSGCDRVVMHGALRQPSLEKLTDSDSAALLHGLPAQAVMTPLATSFGHQETLNKAAQHFLRFHTNSVPVVNDGGQLVGILSEKDVLAVMLHNDWHCRPIADIMQTHVVSYTDQAPASEVYDFLCRVTIRGVVIVNEQREPVGMINRGSLLRFFVNELVPDDSRRISPADNLLAADTRDTSAMLAELSRDTVGMVS